MHRKKSLTRTSMIDLAEHQNDGFIALKDIARRQNISKKYLEQALPLLSADKPREKSMIDNIKKLLPQIEAQLK